MSEIPVGAKVELLPGRDEVYKYAVAGSRGVVRKRKVDDHGYPLVYVEWDKDNWKYNGEEDGWTFESHFKVIDRPDPLREQVEKASARRDEERCLHCGHEHDVASIAQKFVDTLMEAMEEASEGEGFIVLTVKPERLPEFPGKVVYLPRVISATLTPEAEAVLEAQIVHEAAETHKRMVSDLLARRNDEPGR